MSRSERTSCLRVFDRAEVPRANVICFPYSAGAATSFRRLSARMSWDVRLYSVQYPGRQDRFAEAPHESIGDMADEVFDQIATLPVRLTLLFGHSMLRQRVRLAHQLPHRRARGSRVSRVLARGCCGMGPLHHGATHGPRAPGGPLLHRHLSRTSRRRSAERRGPGALTTLAHDVASGAERRSTIEHDSLLL